MPRSNVVEIIIQAREETRAAVRSAAAGMRAFNKAVGDGKRLSDRLNSSLLSLARAYAGFQTVRGVVTVMKGFNQAAFQMQTSLAAAAREFGSMIGSADQWAAAIKSMRADLKIFSEDELQKAASRAIDMTKRLGFSAQQMEQIIRRAGDLGAGKVDLEGAVERVTAAMRGEAESAEYLGLTLNDNYVMSQLASLGITKLWKDMTDLEKAQARYLVFLRQSNEMQGRAASSTSTFSGALAEFRAEIRDVVGKNKDLADAMANLSLYLRENKDEIGAWTAAAVEFGAALAQLAIEHKNLVFALGALIVAEGPVVKLFSVLKNLVLGLNAAFAAMSGMTVFQWLASLRAALAGIVVAGGAAAAAVYGLVAAVVALAAIKVNELINAWSAFRKEMKDLKDTADRLKAAARGFEDFKDTVIKSTDELARMGVDELKAYRKELGNAIGYWSRLKGSLIAKAEERNVLGFLTKEAKEARRQLPEVTAQLRKYEKALRATVGIDPFEWTAEAVAAKEVVERFSLSLDAFQGRLKQFEHLELGIDVSRIEESLEDATAKINALAEREFEILKRSMLNEENYEKAKRMLREKTLATKKQVAEEALAAVKSEIDRSVQEEERYREAAVRARQEKLRIEQLVSDTIRSMRRREMTDEELWEDRVSAAYEKMAKARLAEATGDVENAKRLWEEVLRLFSQIGKRPEQEGPVFTAFPEDFEQEVETAGAALRRLADEDEKKARQAVKEHKEEVRTLTDAYELLKSKLGEIKQAFEVLTVPTLHTVDVDASEAEKTIKRLKEPTTSIHTIHVQTVQESRLGGLMRKMAGGGWIPGFGGGDRIRAMLEAGEFVIRKEAVRKYGAGLFELLNNLKLELPRIALPEIPRFQAAWATGGLAGLGLVGAPSPARTVRLDLKIGGDVFSMVSDEDVASALERKLRRIQKTRL